MDEAASAWTDCCRCCSLNNPRSAPADQQHQQLNDQASISFLDAIIAANDTAEHIEGTAGEDDDYTPPVTICCACLHDFRIAIAFRDRCRLSNRELRERWRQKRLELKTSKYDNDDVDDDFEEERLDELLDVNFEIASELPDDDSAADQEHYSFEISSVYETTQWLLDEADDVNDAGDIDEQVSANEITDDDADAAALTGTANQPLQCNGIQITFACDGCNIEFRSKTLLQQHASWCDNLATANVCDVCGQICGTAATLRRHKRDAHPNESTDDGSGSGTGGAADALELEEDEGNVEMAEDVLAVGNLFQCDYCGKWHSSKRGLMWHMRNMHIMPPVKANHLCATCGKGFSTAQRLRVHNLTHTGERPHRCDLCPMAFANEFRLQSHRRTHTGERPFHCTVCGQMFTQANALKCHMRTHTGERPYRCPVCAKCFAQNTILKTHMTLHTGKTVQCPDCDKKFSRASFLVQHRREHTGDRPYACDRCPKRYMQQCHLSRHMDTHNGVKYPCEQCGKLYSKQWSLKMHMFSHGGTRPFVCGRCPAQFVRKDKWRAHVQKHESQLVKLEVAS